MLGGVPVADSSIKVFASEEYLLLRWLAAHPTTTSRISVVKFSQSEIAQELGCSPTTINKRMQILQQHNCIKPYKKRGNYLITETGQQIIAKMDEIESIIGGHKNAVK